MAWRTAKSLLKLRNQLNEKHPNRSKISDGTIGDAAHQSSNSDHNPWVKDTNGIGVVTAMDITHNNSKGIDCNVLLNKLLAKKDKRIKYIIFDKKIYSAKRDFAPKAYTGKNAHKNHLHISVFSEISKYDSVSNWQI